MQEKWSLRIAGLIVLFVLPRRSNALVSRFMVVAMRVVVAVTGRCMRRLMMGSFTRN